MRAPPTRDRYRGFAISSRLSPGAVTSYWTTVMRSAAGGAIGLAGVELAVR